MLKYKLALVLNRTQEVPNLKKYLDWFSLNTPIEVELIDTFYTDFDVTYKKIGNAVFQGIICDNNIVPKIRTIIPENKYNAVVFYWGNPITDIRVSSVNGGDCSGYLYPDTEVIQLATISDNGKTLNHELFHAFFMKARKCQANVTDNIDTYWNDSDLGVNSFINTNREVALQSLKPYWDKICAFRSLSTPLSTNLKPIVNPMSTYKYFNIKSDPKMLGVNPKLMKILDTIRGECGFPITITSGFRTKEENTKLKGSVEDSAHLLGLAVDVNINTSFKRLKFINSALKNGIKRIGIMKNAVHIDIDSSKDDSIWLYN